VAPERTPLTVVGLFGDDPDSALAEARRDFEQDDLPGARSAAQHAVALLEGATERGVERLRILLASLAALVLGGVALIFAARRRRRHAVVVAAPPAIAPSADTIAPSADTIAPSADTVAPASDAPGAPEPPATLPANFRRDEEGSG
jgi:hypothetical protein